MTPLPWSFSSLDKFTTCPMQYYETRVLQNFKDSPGEAALWGTYVHKCVEDFVECGTPFPENVHIYMPQILEAMGDTCTEVFLAEKEMALNSSFEPCDWKEGWVRGVIDLLKVDHDVAKCIDWKLGKVKPSSRQLKLFALFVFHHYPDVRTVYTSFEWLQFKTRTEEVFQKDQVPELWSAFVPDLQQYIQAFKTDTWQCRPNGLCRGWCPVESCSHWSPKK